MDIGNVNAKEPKKNKKPDEKLSPGVQVKYLIPVQ